MPEAIWVKITMFVFGVLRGIYSRDWYQQVDADTFYPIAYTIK